MECFNLSDPLSEPLVQSVYCVLVQHHVGFWLHEDIFRSQYFLKFLCICCCFGWCDSGPKDFECVCVWGVALGRLCLVP